MATESHDSFTTRGLRQHLPSQWMLARSLFRVVSFGKDAQIMFFVVSATVARASLCILLADFCQYPLPLSISALPTHLKLHNRV